MMERMCISIVALLCYGISREFIWKPSNRLFQYGKAGSEEEAAINLAGFRL